MYLKLKLIWLYYLRNIKRLYIFYKEINKYFNFIF